MEGSLASLAGDCLSLGGRCCPRAAAAALWQCGLKWVYGKLSRGQW